jgi:hypothetical protein
MKVDDLLLLAHDTLQRRAIMPARETVLAEAIVDLLGESQGCGMEAPDTFRFADGRPGIAIGEDTMSASEARVFAAMILRAADEAEALP